LPVFFFYFDTRDQEKETYLGMITSLLYQVAASSSDKFTLDQLENLYANSNRGQIRSIKDVENTLIHIRKAFPSVYYVALDAMDECQEQDKVFLLINRLLKGIPHTHLLLTSRPHVYNRISSAKNAFYVELESEEIAVRSDIEQHVDMKLQSRKISDSLKKEIKEVLVNGANGQ